MKKTTIILSLLLSLVLVFAFAGCGDDKKNNANNMMSSVVSEPANGETVSGEGNITALPDVSAPTFEVPSAPTVAENTIVGSWVGAYDMSELMDMDCSVDITFTFNADNTYTIEVDEAALKDFCEQVINATAENAGTTAEELTAQMDMTVDEYIETSMESMEESLSASGKYKTEGDIIYMNITGDEDFTDEDSSNFTLNGNTLTLTDSTMSITLTRK